MKVSMKDVLRELQRRGDVRFEENEGEKLNKMSTVCDNMIHEYSIVGVRYSKKLEKLAKFLDGKPEYRELASMARKAANNITEGIGKYHQLRMKLAQMSYRFVK